MNRFFEFSPAFLPTFVVGIFSVLSLSILTSDTKIPDEGRKEAKRQEVRLETMEIRDSDRKRWNMNSGYLSLYDAAFLDETTILTLHLQDGFRISNDGGRSWKRMFAESGGVPEATEGWTLNGLEFLDGRTGWAFGSCLIKTVDGGKTWQRIKLPEWMDNIKASFLSENVGFLTGRAGFRGNTSLVVYRTRDGGKTWRKSFRTKEIDSPWDLIVVNSKVAMITAGGGWLWRTADGGTTWKKILSRDYGRVMSISRSHNGRFWLFGKNSIRVSDDLGVTWRDAEGLDKSLIDHEWSSVDFMETGLGVAVAEDSAIALTRDGGLTWREIRSNLHSQDRIQVPDNPFDEALRGIRLYGKRGIINGSQRDYIVTISDLE